MTRSFMKSVQAHAGIACAQLSTCVASLPLAGAASAALQLAFSRISQVTSSP